MTSLKPTRPQHEIVVLPESGSDRRKLLEQCFGVRIEVFSNEQGFPLESEIDDIEDEATHILLRLIPSLTPIGTIRGYNYRGPGEKYYKLTRLAVLKEYRGFGFGALLVRGLHSWIQDHAENSGFTGSAKAVCHSQIDAIPFYQKFGYQPQGNLFDEEGALHQKMVVTLSLPK